MLYFRDLTNAHRIERMRVDFQSPMSAMNCAPPLSSVLGFIETLEGPARGTIRRAARVSSPSCAKQALRMTRLIDELLSLSRIELRAHVAPTEAIDLMPVIRQILDTLAPLAKEEGVTFHEALPDGPAIVCGDRDELLRLVENLVENAVKYGGAGGRVDIALTPPEAAGRGLDAQRAGLRAGHRTRRPAASHRALLSRRYRDESQERRHRARPQPSSSISWPVIADG